MSGRPIAVSISALAALMLSACGAGGVNVRADDGSLMDCTTSAHCVSSTATDPGNRVEPLHYSGSPEAAQRALAKIIGNMRGGAVVENAPGYMRAEFTSPVFRYVDDVQFLLQQDHVIQLRSSSRIGYYDFGANRKRVEAIRKAFDAVQP